MPDTVTPNDVRGEIIRNLPDLTFDGIEIFAVAHPDRSGTMYLETTTSDDVVQNFRIEITPVTDWTI